MPVKTCTTRKQVWEVSMKSGLGDRNNTRSLALSLCLLRVVSMKSGLGDRNNLGAKNATRV